MARTIQRAQERRALSLLHANGYEVIPSTSYPAQLVIALGRPACAIHWRFLLCDTSLRSANARHMHMMASTMRNPHC